VFARRVVALHDQDPRRCNWGLARLHGGASSRRHGPVGRPLDDVRAIRDDIGHRIRSLIADLNDD